MKIVRTMPDEGWVPIANTAARDHRLSWRARGLLAELLSYPDGWETSVDKLVDMANAAGGNTEGRDAMRNAMNELIRFGYVRRVRYTEHGRWLTRLEVTDGPTPDFQASVVQASADQSSVVQSSVDQASLERRTTNTDTKNDLSQRSSAEDSASLISFAAAADAATKSDLRERLLEKIYDVIDNLTPGDRRAHMLTVEGKRPRIYREARNGAIRQMREHDPRALKSEHAVMVTDRLSYKYVAQHYVATTGELPLWFARPMGWKE